VRFALRGVAEAMFTAGGQGSGLPIDLVVLEHAGVSRAPQDPQATEHLRLALLAAKRAGVPVLAQGVSSVEAREWLIAEGCRLGAGSQFATPVAADAVQAFLAQRVTAPV
jgi:EAL domain-containing protein (putative c-di-GMP-specific phosphodiesterase class I)